MHTGLYLHIPFCRARCSYCDFNTYVGLENLFEPYVRALEQEVRRSRAADFDPSMPRQQAHTIFFGGGTPSLLTPEQIGDLIRACRETFDIPAAAEVTAECNPGTVNVEILGALRDAGVNRLSFGAQSADPEELRLLGREHGWDQVRAAIAASREAGFDDVNLDLIFGLPYQSLDSWRRTVDAALALAPDHISLYALTIEQGTPMHDWTRRGEVPFPDPDLAADMYDHAEQAMGGAGLAHYEISNWCRPGHACAHNLIYWRNEPYFGLGAGAHGSTLSRRRWNVRRPAEYIARVERGESPEADGEDIDAPTSRGETMMLGLRLLEEGVSRARFRERFGVSIEDVYARELDEGVAKNLIEVTPERVRLTPSGRFLSNQVMRLFV